MDIFKNEIDRILKEFDYKEDSLIPILLKIQGLSDEKYISKERIIYTADKMDIKKSRIYEVVTFFSAINLKPKGKYHIQICESSVCKINGIDTIVEYLTKSLNIKVGERTEDQVFSLDYTPCFGACDKAPAIRINKKVYGYLSNEKVEKILEDLRGGSDE